MALEVVLPDLGEDSDSEATVSFWHFEEGDHLEEGDEMVEMTTDKAAFAVPSPAGGILAKIMVGEGDVVRIGDPIAVIEEDGDD